MDKQPQLIDENDLILRTISLGQFVSPKHNLFRFQSQTSNVFRNAAKKFAFTNLDFSTKIKDTEEEGKASVSLGVNKIN